MKCHGCGSETHLIANCPKGRGGKCRPKPSFFEAQGAAHQHHFANTPPPQQHMSIQPVTTASLFADAETSILL
eukprot:10249709-Karenia_brevis.AAC.1